VCGRSEEQAVQVGCATSEERAAQVGRATGSGLRRAAFGWGGRPVAKRYRKMYLILVTQILMLFDCMFICLFFTQEMGKVNVHLCLQ
jgi:hypothetical protein